MWEAEYTASCRLHTSRLNNSNFISIWQKESSRPSCEIRIEINEELDSIIDKLKKAFKESSKSPYFLEINSYRLFEHCGHKLDISTGDRNIEEFKFFEAQDRVSKWIKEDKLICDSYDKAYQECIRRSKIFADETISLKKI